MTHADDIDYDQFLHRHQNPDLQPDLHWTFLPSSEIAKQAAANPPQHKILLVPADPDNSPTEDELWPVVHQAALDCRRGRGQQSHRRPLRLAKSSALP